MSKISKFIELIESGKSVKEAVLEVGISFFTAATQLRKVGKKAEATEAYKLGKLEREESIG